MMALYDLPNWLLGVTIVGATMGMSYAGYFLFHRLIRMQFSDTDRGLAMSVLGIVATVNSLLLAFSAVSVWESFRGADAAVTSEANTIQALARDLAVFDTPRAADARMALRRYTETVINDEWAYMRTGAESLKAWDSFDDMFRAIATLELDSPREQTWMYEIFWRTNELLAQRRTRLYSAQSRVPGMLWTVVLLGTGLCMVMTYVLPPIRFHLAMIGALAFSLGLVFFFIFAMDRPFAGNQSISPTPFRDALVGMERWDHANPR